MSRRWLSPQPMPKVGEMDFLKQNPPGNFSAFCFHHMGVAEQSTGGRIGLNTTPNHPMANRIKRQRCQGRCAAGDEVIGPIEGACGRPHSDRGQPGGGGAEPVGGQPGRHHCLELQPEPHRGAPYLPRCAPFSPWDGGPGWENGCWLAGRGWMVMYSFETWRLPKCNIGQSKDWSKMG